MPISREKAALYPPEWPLISLWVRVCAGWRCEWCSIEQGEPVRSGRPWWVVLTVAHVNGSRPGEREPADLVALCQACHLHEDIDHHIRNRRENARRAMRTGELPLEAERAA